MPKLIRIALLGIWMVSLALPAAAQLDPSTRIYEVFQDGNKVAEIYVPRGQKKSLRVEHWVLFPGYTYPSLASGIGFEIAQSESLARTESDFFRRPFPEGSRYIEVTGHGADHLPCGGPR